MKYSFGIVFWAEVMALLQAVVVVALSVACLLGFLEYRIAYPFPLASPERRTPAAVTPNVPPQTPQSIPIGPPTDVRHNQVERLIVSPSLPPENSKRSPEDLAATYSQPEARANANAATQALTEAEKLFEDGRYPEALARSKAALSMDPGNPKAKELKEKIEKTIEILGH